MKRALISGIGSISLPHRGSIETSLTRRSTFVYVDAWEAALERASVLGAGGRSQRHRDSPKPVGDRPTARLILGYSERLLLTQAV